MEDRRRWGRVKVPEEKLSCIIAEPDGSTPTGAYLVDNINPGGLSFLSNRSFEAEQIMKLLIKFPFSSFIEAGTVWGRVSYCLKIHDKEQFVVGIAFVRKKGQGYK
jgi:hypothetical protein